MGWKSVLRADPTEWLLTEGEPWVRYRALVDLLDGEEDAPEVIEARREMLADERIEGLVAALRDEELGIPAIRGEKVITHIKPDSFYWVLCFLAEIGLTKDELGLGEMVETLFDPSTALRRGSGQGSGHRLVSPGDFFASVQEGERPICLAAVLSYSLARLGYSADPGVQSCYDHLLRLRAPDGGWHCAFMQRRWKRLQESPHTCPLANLDGLRALSVAPELWGEAERIVDLLLLHWEERGGPYRPYGFGIGAKFRNLRYPPTPYDILGFADVLSRFPYARGQPAFREVVDEILSKQDEEGRFYAESVSRAWRTFDFGQKKAPSSWITFLALRTIKQAFVS